MANSTEKQNARDLRSSKQFNNGENINEPENPDTYNTDMGGSSNITAGDQVSMRRRLEQNKLQDRNIRDASTQADKNQPASASEGQEDKSVRARWQKVKNERKNIKEARKKLSEKAGLSGAGSEAANKAANQAIRQAYNYIQSVIEGFIFDLFFLIFIFGLPYFILWFARPLLSLIGMLTIKIKGVKVKAVPGYSLQELPVRVGALVGILALFVVEWFIITIIIWALTNPLDAIFELNFGIIYKLIKLLL